MNDTALKPYSEKCTRHPVHFCIADSSSFSGDLRVGETGTDIPLSLASAGAGGAGASSADVIGLDRRRRESQLLQARKVALDPRAETPGVKLTCHSPDHYPSSPPALISLSRPTAPEQGVKAAKHLRSYHGPGFQAAFGSQSRAAVTVTLKKCQQPTSRPSTSRSCTLKAPTTSQGTHAACIITPFSAPQPVRALKTIAAIASDCDVIT
eukprot:COSAG02_NODE_7787_length_2845_cov_1.769847_4_plen_209_part_00